MSSVPSPILIFGDIYVSKNNIIAAKKKYPDLRWVTKSATSETLNDIRAEVGTSSWDDSEKIVIIQELPNRKNVREFLLNLAQTCPPTTKLIVWDSTNQIKIDPKEKTIDKTWGDFISGFKNISGSKVINNGEQLTEKDGEDSVNFIIKKFADKGKVIEQKEAKLLLSIIGFDRGMLESDIQKMCLTAPDYIKAQFLLDNAFPSTKEAVLYKLANSMDAGSYEDCLNIMERFLSSGINHNVIAEIVVKKARWQMVATHLWYSGLSWEDIPDKIMDMGKFPSSIWHDFQINSTTKKAQSTAFQNPKGILEYMVRNQGIPDRIIKIKVEEEKPKEPKEGKEVKEVKVKTTRKGAEIMPMYFMAEQTVNFVKNSVVNYNRTGIDPKDLREKVMDRAINVYLFVHEKLDEIRYGQNPEQDLQEMVAAIMSVRLI